tara:strand:- start:872 stop:1096 length:225 start_codon:yes stop_codon:yes gene_type:complete
MDRTELNCIRQAMLTEQRELLKAVLHVRNWADADKGEFLCPDAEEGFAMVHDYFTVCATLDKLYEVSEDEITED